MFSIIWLVLSLASSKGDVDLTRTMFTNRHLVTALQIDFLGEGKDLPISFEDIPTFREIVKIAPENAQYINEIAIVPGAPVIQPDPAIPQRRWASRLFAIGRIPNSDYARPASDPDSIEQGRYSIIISSDGSNSLPAWLPETEVQAILKQLDGFDPEQQPLVFQDMNEAEMGSDAPEQSSAAMHDPNSSRKKKMGESVFESNEQPKVQLWVWVIIFLLVALSGFAVFRVRARR